jgi:amino acid permease
MAGEELFTRGEVLGGLPAQRARTLLYLIESRTAHLVARSRRAMLWDQTDRAAQQEDLEFLEAFAAGKDPPLKPTIQDLERFAPQWQTLVPENPALRASLAKLLGEKYSLDRRAIPNLRRVLALDDPATRQAFQRQQLQALESIYAPRTTLAERLRWLQSKLAGRLESLPPFWTAFSLTLTETVGVGILALPIALAGVGPLPGVVLIVLMGLINLLTIAYMTEAVARSGDIRFGNAYFGRLVSDLLGRNGSILLRVCLVMIYALALLAFFIGISTTLADAIGLPAIAWTVLIFLVNIYFLRKESLDATISAALLVGFVNIGLILAICLITFPAVKMEYLTWVRLPFQQGKPFDPSFLALVFGTILLAFFGHTSMGICAKVVLQRDSSGRSLIWGSLTAQIAAIVLYSAWVLAVNGAIAPQVLAVQRGTSLVPLAKELGPAIGVLGSSFVILAMGMGSIHYSLGFYNLMREWLPARRQPESTSQGRLNALPPSEAGREEGFTVSGQMPSMEEDLQPAGLSPVNLLDLPEDQRRLVEIMLRLGETTAEELASQSGSSQASVQDALQALARQGFVLSTITPQGNRHLVRLSPRRGAHLPDHLWQALEIPPPAEDKPEDRSARKPASLLQELLQSSAIRFLLGASPIVAIFLITVWLLASGQESFTQPISFLGLIVVSLLGGAFPVLLLIASRRKGELIPQMVYRSLGNPLFLGTVYLISIGGLFLHGLLIWQNTLERLVALLAAILMLTMTVLMYRRGVFQPRANLELVQQADQPDQVSLTLIVDGQPYPAEATLTYKDSGQRRQPAGDPIIDLLSLDYIDIHLPAIPYKDLKVWAYVIAHDGSSYSLPVQLEVHIGEKVQRYDLKSYSGQFLFPGSLNRKQAVRDVRLSFASETVVK